MRDFSKIEDRKFANFEEENFHFAKIQDRMYEKHESYGVLKLSKQALQKGKLLNFDPPIFFGNTFGTDPNSSE